MPRDLRRRLQAARHVENQLVESAFDEEEYELGIECVGQLLSHGLYPSGDVIRSLLAISLVSLSSPNDKDEEDTVESSRSSWKKRKPSIKAILDATSLLSQMGGCYAETMGETLLPWSSIVLSALPPCSLPHPASSTRSTFRVPRLGHKRRSEEIESESEDECLRAGLKRTSRVKAKADEIAKASDIWEVFATEELGSKGRKEITAKPIGRSNGEREGDEEEDEMTRHRDEYGREGVWRCAEVLNQCWNKQYEDFAYHRIGDDGQTIKPHLALQCNLDLPFGRRNRKEGLTYDFGKATAFLASGIHGTSSYTASNKERKSHKAWLHEKHRRIEIVMSLYTNLYNLTSVNSADRRAIVKNVVDIIQRSTSLETDAIMQAAARGGYLPRLELFICAIQTLLQSATPLPGKTLGVGSALLRLGEPVEHLDKDVWMSASPSSSTIIAAMSEDARISLKEVEERYEDTKEALKFFEDAWSISKRVEGDRGKRTALESHFSRDALEKVPRRSDRAKIESIALITAKGQSESYLRSTMSRLKLALITFLFHYQSQHSDPQICTRLKEGATIQLKSFMKFTKLELEKLKEVWKAMESFQKGLVKMCGNLKEKQKKERGNHFLRIFTRSLADFQVSIKAIESLLDDASVIEEQSEENEEAS